MSGGTTSEKLTKLQTPEKRHHQNAHASSSQYYVAGASTMIFSNEAPSLINRDLDMVEAAHNIPPNRRHHHNTAINNNQGPSILNKRPSAVVSTVIQKKFDGPIRQKPAEMAGGGPLKEEKKVDEKPKATMPNTTS